MFARLRHADDRLTRLAAVLVACALALRILIPSGWMLDRQPDGVHLILCDGMAPASGHAAMAGMTHAMPLGHAPTRPDGTTADHPCAFSSLAQAALPAALAPAAPLLAPLATDAPARPLSVLPGRGLAAPPPLSTGPPLLA